MASVSFIYSLLQKKRKKVLGLFKETSYLNFQTDENSWSAEHIFRHLLTALNWLEYRITGNTPELHPLAIKMGTFPNDRATLDQISDAFDQLDTDIMQSLDQLSESDLNQGIKTWLGMKNREEAIISLIDHEHSHLGQIIWLYKRASGLSSNMVHDIE